MGAGWNQHIIWTVGHNNDTPPALTIDSFSDSSLDIGLTAATPSNSASIGIDLGDIVNLAAFGSGPVSGTFAASATGNASVTIINGHLRGTNSTALSIDVTASLPAEHATIHLHLTDDLHFTLTGKGYVGSTVTQTAESGGSAQAFSQTGTCTGIRRRRWDVRLGEIRDQYRQHHCVCRTIYCLSTRQVDPRRG